MIDKKINSKELAKGLIVDNVEILPPCTEEYLSQLRLRKQIPYQKIYGKVYYQISDLIRWSNSKKIEVEE